MPGMLRLRTYTTPSVRLFHPRHLSAGRDKGVRVLMALCLHAGREKKVTEAKLPPFIRARDLAKKLGINLKDVTRRLSSEG